MTIWPKLLLLLELRWSKSDTIMIMSMQMPVLVPQSINDYQDIQWYSAQPSINHKAPSYGLMTSRLVQVQLTRIISNDICLELHSLREKREITTIGNAHCLVLQAMSRSKVLALPVRSLEMTVPKSHRLEGARSQSSPSE